MVGYGERVVPFVGVGRGFVGTCGVVLHMGGDLFWLYAWGAVTLFSVFMAMFYSQLIVPLFNKQTPLQEGSLRDKIQAFAGKVGFKLDNIYVIDGSKRSTKANAYFTGLGPKSGLSCMTR